jgi:hypothetical protein
VKLSELEPEFLKCEEDGRSLRYVTIAEADGIIFLCPVCFTANKGNVGTHAIICWRPHIAQTVSPGPGRWQFSGSGLADLTLVAGSSSIFLTTAQCRAHFFIRSGEIAYA